MTLNLRSLRAVGSARVANRALRTQLCRACLIQLRPLHVYTNGHSRAISIIDLLWTLQQQQKIAQNEQKYNTILTDEGIAVLIDKHQLVSLLKRKKNEGEKRPINNTKISWNQEVF